MPWTSPEHVEAGRGKEKRGGLTDEAPPSAREHLPGRAGVVRSAPDFFAGRATATVSSQGRVRVAGKFFADGQGRDFAMRGVVYGPFPPNSAGAHFPEAEVLRRDLARIRELGATCLRIFHAPTEELLEACGGLDLRLIVTFPWSQHVDFLRDRALGDSITAQFRELVRGLAGDARIAAFLVGNEVPPDVVRWRGVDAVREFLERLVDAGRQEDPGALFSYANFPPTEYLQPRNLDFLCFNLYLHQPEKLTAYLRRLHHLAGNMPVVVGEFGMDSAAEGEEAQAAYYGEQVTTLREMAVAGEIAFSYTDEWFTGGKLVEGWSFGLVRRDRTPKAAFNALRDAWAAPLNLPGVSLPKVSVIVCGYNAATTLRACLESLRHLEYPDYEVIMVDDGSRDGSRELVAEFPEVRLAVMEHAGLSAARNHGAQLATGEILAYTDADCQAHPLWLHYAVQALTRGQFAAAGGPNIPPPAISLDQACVAAAPGGPREVMLDDLVAEHLPGCNLLVWKSAFEYIGGFDPEFHAAGDDVDFCWRLTACGFRLGFHPGAMVWHERRRSIGAYFRQQRGYGEAEALLWRKHQQAFAGWGTIRWQGRIYEAARPETLLTPRVYSGRFGGAMFQSIYTKATARLLRGSFEWFTLACAWLLVDLAWGNIPFAPALLFMAIGAAAVRSSFSTHVEGNFGGVKARLLLATICMLQPLIRGLTRWWKWFGQTTVPAGVAKGEPFSLRMVHEFAYWSDRDGNKFQLLEQVLRRLTERRMPHGVSDGWQDWDLQLMSTPFVTLRLRTATEYHGDGRNLIRVGLSWGLSTAAILGFLLLIIVCMGLASQFPDSFVARLACFVPLPFYMPALYYHYDKLYRAIHEILRESAAELSLKPLDSKSQP